MEPLKIFLLIVYALSVSGCVVGLVGAAETLKAADRPYESSIFIVAIAGFTVFPVINTFIALACMAWAAKGFRHFNFS